MRLVERSGITGPGFDLNIDLARKSKRTPTAIQQTTSEIFSMSLPISDSPVCSLGFG
jgi:hypothetical protein